MKVEKLTEKQLAVFYLLQAEAEDQRAQERPESKEPASTEVKPPEGNGQNGEQNPPPPEPPKADKKKSRKKKGA